MINQKKHKQKPLRAYQVMISQIKTMEELLEITGIR
jgi:hypothetical protein